MNELQFIIMRGTPALCIEFLISIHALLWATKGFYFYYYYYYYN